MTDDNPNREEPQDVQEIPRATLEEAADILRDHVDDETGIRPNDLQLVANGPVVSARLYETVLAEHSFEPESWEWEANDSPRPTAQAILVALDVDTDDLQETLVERRRDRLADVILEEAEAEIQTRIAAAAPAVDWDLSLDVVELAYDYHHGDPPWVYERGYPPFGLEVLSWNRDIEIVVEIEHDPPNVDRLVDRAVTELLEAVDGA